MDARLRRIASDYEQIKKDFAGHKNIIVTPIGDEPRKNIMLHILLTVFIFNQMEE